MRISNFLAIIMLALLASCQKSNAPVPDAAKNTPGSFASKNLVAATTDVYITGMMKLSSASNQVVPVYWKNGVANTVPHIGDAEALTVAIAGSDVYLAGYDTEVGGTIQPCYWKDGVEHLLPVPNHFTGTTYAIAVQGSDVYVVGSYFTHDSNETQRAMVWKNGVGTLLAFNNDNSVATGIAINGSNVYISGNATFNGVSCAVYWKNNIWHPFAGITQNSQATGIVVDSHNNFYISGSDTSGTGYWKDAIFRPLPDETGVSTPITINSTNDVYTGGQKGQGPAYWKNGQAVSLVIKDLTTGSVQAIAIGGGDVYTAVYYFTMSSGSAYSYYKNTAAVQNLANATSVFGMAVVQH